MQENNNSDNNGVDLSMIKSFCDTDEDLNLFIDTFVKQTKEDLIRLSQNCTDGENLSWSEMAHKMKGGCATFGATEMKILCAQAQEMKVATIAERRALFNQLEQSFQDVLDYLDRTYPSRKTA
jgi:HPt (histidine-containing phosphotransfer) domain-containing protein